MRMWGHAQAGLPGLPPGPKFFSVAQLLQSQSQADRKKGGVIGFLGLGCWGHEQV